MRSIRSGGRWHGASGPRSLGTCSHRRSPRSPPSASASASRASSGASRRFRDMPRLAATVLAAAALLAPATAHAAEIPTFDVGTAVVDITPTTPQFLGGYDKMDRGTADAHDPLQVRAFFVGHGGHAVEFAIVDSQGWFAGYQEGAYGVTDARQAAATEVSRLGYSVTPANFIVSSTHSHAAPTIMGIWGPT